jgi:alcohol dehydrogenase YqhD (iron-dependent ADH family)
MVLNTGIAVLRKFWYENLQKILFGEGQVQDPNPALPGHRSKILAVLLGDR